MMTNESTPDTGTQSTDERRVSVLVVEDNYINRQVAVGFLKALGCRVEVATDGRRGAQLGSSGRYDLVFMDLQMPLMDGFEATRQIRASERGSRVRVVALTANATEADRQRSIAAGMDAFLTKPIRREELARVIAAAGLPQAAAASIAPPAASASAPNAPTMAGEGAFELETLLDCIDRDPEGLRELVGIFAADSARLLHRVTQAAGRGDLEALRREAHTLKGAVGTVGGVAAFGAWKAAEDAARQGDPALVERAVSGAIGATEQLRQALKDFAAGYVQRASEAAAAGRVPATGEHQ